MPIAYDGKIYEDEYALETGRPAPVEPRTEASGRPRVYIRPDDNNASVGNVEGVRGIVDDTSGNSEIGVPIINDGGEFSPGTKFGNAFVDRTQDVIKGIIQSTINIVKAPGDAMQGKLPMWAIDPETGEVNTSPEALQRAADLAQIAVTGPAPIAAKMADGTLGSFMGVKSKTFNRNDLAHAQILEANQVSPEEIFQKTGMFRGAEGRWKSEISDKDSKLNQDWNIHFENEEGLSSDMFGGKVRVNLPDVLDHPELYKAYPELKDVLVVYDPNKHGASYNSVSNAITVGPALVNNKHVYLHEIQHAIQDIEGFAKGGQAVKEPRLRYEDDVKKLTDEFFAMQKPLSSQDRERAKYIHKVLTVDLLRKKAAVEKAYENYLSLAGEVEARNVELRSPFSKEEARNFYPEHTEDTPRAGQIVSDVPVFTTPYGISPDNPRAIPNE